MSNFYQVEKEINGVNYVAQFNGISANLKAIDNSYIEGTNNTSVEKLANYLFKHVIVEPRIDIDDFGKDQIGTVETAEIGGKTYKAEFKGMRAAIRAIDGSYIDGTSNTSTEKLANYLFSEIITQPKKLSADDFDSMEEFNEVVSFAREAMQGHEAMENFNAVVSFAREVMQGNFRDKKNDKSAKATGTK